MRISSAIQYEEKWLRKWEEDRVFEADPEPGKPRIFVTFPYSYQNGPLHIGHGFTATRADIYARYRRMKGYNVLFPWAWHWTGEAVAGTSERLRRGDPTVLRVLREIDKVPEEHLAEFTDPAKICRYYTEENRQVARLIGFSIDWRREFHTSDLHPYYSRFVDWQYRTLQALGLLKKGSHPVVWCPSCESPTGDHDRLVGEGVSPVEFTLVYFKLDQDGPFLAASTLRPETIFGATNLWLRTDAVYLEISQGETRLIVSREAYEKLKEQVRDVRMLKEISGADLIGRYCKAPITGEPLIILPADFVDPGFGTGVVYSVPSHAPYDYAGLKDLRKNPEKMIQLGVNPATLEELTPIHIIDTVGLGLSPAVYMVESSGIESSADPRLERLTQDLYSKEFYNGVLNERCGEYGGLSVREARERVRERLLKSGLGGVMYDLPEPVVCRSGDRCIVKIVEDQWFLAYSDEGWKRLVREHVSESLKIFPEGARQWLLNVIDWLKDWPCTRKTGLGTRFPFDQTWIVETLSDSTIYPALYTISKYLNAGVVRADQLTVELLDYVFRGEGEIKHLSEKLHIDSRVVESMRQEFNYWYPVDLRVSAKDLLPNHLTFYLFQHVAILPREKWPRAIAVNGLVRIEGEEMHKSRGNFVSLKDAIGRVGADATRLGIILAAEDMDDPDWRWKNAEDLRRYLDSFLKLVQELACRELDKEWQEADHWVLTHCQEIIEEIEESIENLKTRSAATKALYDMDNMFRKYLRRRGGSPGPATHEILRAWIRVLAPFVPFTAEEAWNVMGMKGYVSLSSWPSFKDRFDEKLLLRDEVLDLVIEDVRRILRVMRREPKEAHIFVAPAWMQDLLRKYLGVITLHDQTILGRIARELASRLNQSPTTLQALAKKILETSQNLSAKYSASSILEVAKHEEEVYKSNISYLERELGVSVTIQRAEEQISDPKASQKAAQATMFRPGIYVA